MRLSVISLLVMIDHTPFREKSSIVLCVSVSKKYHGDKFQCQHG